MLDGARLLRLMVDISTTTEISSTTYQLMKCCLFLRTSATIVSLITLVDAAIVIRSGLTWPMITL